MEITADEITEGDNLVDIGVVREWFYDHDEDGTYIVVRVGRDEYTFARDEMVQVRA